MIAIDILHLVDRLEELIMEGRVIPLSTRVAVDKEPLLDIVDQMRLSVPAEVKKAKRIQQERERIIAQANEEAGRIVRLSKEEGIIPALEPSHALAFALKLAQGLNDNKVVVVTLSGRGDKDIFTVADAFADPRWREFIRKKAGEYGA